MRRHLRGWQAADRKGYEEIVFPTIKKVLPLIMGWDNHDISHYEVKAPCWIKGDPRLRTFQQLIGDPQRAFLGETPVERSASRAIRRSTCRRFSSRRRLVEVRRRLVFGLVKLNPGLVAIIGDKGSGKTALARRSAYWASGTSAKAFSFLNEKKFRQPRNHKAKEFQATLTWRSEHTSTRSLGASTDENAPAAISYIPRAT